VNEYGFRSAPAAPYVRQAEAYRSCGRQLRPDTDLAFLTIVDVLMKPYVDMMLSRHAAALNYFEQWRLQVTDELGPLQIQ